jgi:hypothetical protein
MIRTEKDDAMDRTMHVGTGRVTVEEWIAELVVLDSAGPALHQLWDFSAADLSGMSLEGIRTVAKLVSDRPSLNTGGKIAIVASSDVGFGVCRQYEAMVECLSLSIRIHAFRSVDEARRWIQGKSTREHVVPRDHLSWREGDDR